MTSQHPSRPVVAICTSCEYRWRADESELGTRIPCPECEEPSVVRRASEDELTDVPGLAPDDGYRRSAGPSVVPVGMEDVSDASKRDESPKWTFFSGVFTFPFYPDVFVRWVGISLIALLTGYLATLAIAGGKLEGKIDQAAPPVFSLVGASVLLFLAGPYTAACFLTILRDTASGCNKIVDWPGIDFREWFLTPRFFLMMFAAAAAVGYGLQRAIDTDSVLPIAITIFVLFPVFLLSSLEADSALIPITKPVFRSLFVLAGPWLVVYLEMAGIVAGVILVFRWALDERSSWALPIAICTAVAGILVYARILGRLAWRASRYETEKKDPFAAAIAPRSSTPNGR